MALGAAGRPVSLHAHILLASRRTPLKPPPLSSAATKSLTGSSGSPPARNRRCTRGACRCCAWALTPQPARSTRATTSFCGGCGTSPRPQLVRRRESPGRWLAACGWCPTRHAAVGTVRQLRLRFKPWPECPQPLPPPLEPVTCRRPRRQARPAWAARLPVPPPLLRRRPCTGRGRARPALPPRAARVAHQRR